MQQMFADMYAERKQSDKPMLGFVLKVYLDTGAGVVTECFKEMIMSSKTMRIKIFIAGGIVVLLAVAVTFVLLNGRQATIIPPMSSLEQVRELSKGKKDTCLTDNQQAADAVKRDDTSLDYAGNKFSRFEMVASEGIMDVPAGTNYEMAITTYDGTTVRGAIAYEKDYGAYNYTIKKLAGVGEWRFVSMTACNNQ
jgi:hypothetical protein